MAISKWDEMVKAAALDASILPHISSITADKLFDRSVQEILGPSGVQGPIGPPGVKMSTAYTEGGSLTPLGQLMARLLKGRLGLQEGYVMPTPMFRGIEIIDVRQHGEEFHIYVDTKKVAPFVMKDNANLFPSDGLITQFYTLAPDAPVQDAAANQANGQYAKTVVPSAPPQRPSLLGKITA